MSQPHQIRDETPVCSWWHACKDNLEVKWSPVQLWIRLGEETFVVKDDPTVGDVWGLCDALGLSMEQENE